MFYYTRHPLRMKGAYSNDSLLSYLMWPNLTILLIIPAVRQKIPCMIYDRNNIVKTYDATTEVVLCSITC